MAERPMSTINVCGKTIEVRTVTDKKTANVSWVAYLVDKPSGQSLRLAERGKRADLMEYLDRYMAASQG
jgi:hypothetical protein